MSGPKAKQISGIGAPSETVTPLVNNVATTVLSLATVNAQAYGAILNYRIEIIDAGGVVQTETGTVRFSVIDTAGGVLAGTPVKTASRVLQSNSLFTQWSVDTTDDGSVELRLVSNSSLTPVTHNVHWIRVL